MATCGGVCIIQRVISVAFLDLVTVASPSDFNGLLVKPGLYFERKSTPYTQTIFRASVLPFQKCVNSVSGFANPVFYRFRFGKFRFLPVQIFKIPFHFFQAVFLLSIIFVFNKVSVSAF